MVQKKVSKTGFLKSWKNLKTHMDWGGTHLEQKSAAIHHDNNMKVEKAHEGEIICVFLLLLSKIWLKVMFCLGWTFQVLLHWLDMWKLAYYQMLHSCIFFASEVQRRTQQFSCLVESQWITFFHSCYVGQGLSTHPDHFCSFRNSFLLQALFSTSELLWIHIWLGDFFVMSDCNWF